MDEEWYCRRINVVNKPRDPKKEGWFVPKPPLDKCEITHVLDKDFGVDYLEEEFLEDDIEIDKNKWINDEKDVELRSHGKTNLDASWRNEKVESGLLDLFEELMQHKAYRYNYAWDTLDTDAIEAVANANDILLAELFGYDRFDLVFDIQTMAILQLGRRMEADELSEECLATGSDSANSSSDGIHHSDSD